MKNDRLVVMQGIQVFLCYTFPVLSIKQIEITAAMLEKEGNNEVLVDHINNEGFPIFADGIWITGCEKTARILKMQGAKESSDPHIFPIFSRRKTNITDIQTTDPDIQGKESQGGALPGKILP